MPTDLWSFTLDFYSRPGVEQACLDLQSHGANVCLLLFGIWLDQRSAEFEAARVHASVELTWPWEAEVVRPLRELRTQWRTAASTDATLSGMREAIKKLELKAEQELLQRLEHLANGWPNEATRNKHQWLAALAGEAAGLSRDALDTLRAAADQT